jgi:hypothetical protein
LSERISEQRRILRAVNKSAGRNPEAAGTGRILPLGIYFERRFLRAERKRPMSINDKSPQGRVRVQVFEAPGPSGGFGVLVTGLDGDDRVCTFFFDTEKEALAFIAEHGRRMN